jgi:hypothetical protein
LEQTGLEPEIRSHIVRFIKIISLVVIGLQLGEVLCRLVLDVGVRLEDLERSIGAVFGVPGEAAGPPAHHVVVVGVRPVDEFLEWFRVGEGEQGREMGGEQGRRRGREGEGVEARSQQSPTARAG